MEFAAKTIQQSNDLIVLESNCRFKKLSDSNGYNTIKPENFEAAILKYAIHSNFSICFLFTG